MTVGTPICSSTRLAMPAMEASFYPLERSGDVFNWDPI